MACLFAPTATAANSAMVTWIMAPKPGCDNISKFAVSPDGNTVALIQCTNGYHSPLTPEIYTIATDGTKLRYVANLGLFDAATHVRVSNGGTKIAYIMGLTFEGSFIWTDLYVVDGATGVTQILTGPTGGHIVDQIDMSPDGSKILFDRYHSDPALYGTFLINSDGTGMQKIFDSPGENCLSGDGSTVAVSAWVAGGQRKIFVMNSDGTNVRSISTPEEHDVQPWLNHDGTVVTFVSAYETSLSTVRSYVAHTDGAYVAVLQQYSNDAQISGDGNWVLLADAPPGTGAPDLARIRPDGTGKEIVFPCGGAYYHRYFSHDGSFAVSSCATYPGVTKGMHFVDWNLPNLKLVGVPKIGNTISLVLNGTSGQPFVWFLSLGAASIPVPPYGTFGIDPSSLSVLVGGTLNSVGKYTLQATLPQEPVLIGAHAYLQAVAGDAPLVIGGKLTNALDLAIEG
jgi:hypothetical protein